MALSFIQKINICAWVIVYLIIFSQPLFAETKQPKNILQCFSCFFKKPSDWTWEQEKRKGIREDPKYITCRRYKVVKTNSNTIEFDKWLNQLAIKNGVTNY